MPLCVCAGDYKGGESLKMSQSRTEVIPCWIMNSRRCYAVSLLFYTYTYRTK